MRDWSHRHPSTQGVLRHFTYDHLPPALQQVSGPCCDLAECLVELLPDGPELTRGLVELLRAKDEFVRAARFPAAARQAEAGTA
jgi:hypothetical protein